MKFEEISSWGFVNLGTKITDSEGNQYIVESQNEAGFLRLKNISGGEHKVFEAMDRINHSKYRMSE